MNAAVFYGPNDIRIEDIEIKNSSNENILLKLRCCSVCSYDVRTFRNGSFKVKTPVILGHEICATTVDDYYGKNFTIKANTRVSLYPVIPCLNCWYCFNKRYNLCSNLKEIGSTIDGGFAEYTSVPKKLFEIGGIVPVSDNISDEEAALVEPLACCINSINQIKNFDFESAIILGDGPIGIMQLLLLKKVNPKRKIIVCGKVPDRLKSALQMGADQTYLISEEKGDGMHVDIEKIKESVNSESPNLVFVSNNNPLSVISASMLVNKGGKIVIFSGIKKGTIQNKQLVANNIDYNYIHYNEIGVHGSFSSNPENLNEAMKLLNGNEIDLRPLINNKFSLFEIEKAFELTESFNGLKSVINRF
jgi:L-iditol 2-dehydrogenase